MQDLYGHDSVCVMPNPLAKTRESNSGSCLCIFALFALMGRYCKVHRGPERVQVLEVNVSLIDIEVGTSAYLVLVAKAIAVTRVKDRIGPKCLRAWGHG